jgi:hypothetical protein
MTSKQQQILSSLNRRISKFESAELAKEIHADEAFASIIFEKLESGSAKVASNILWSIRSLKRIELSLVPDLCHKILYLIEKFPNEEGILRDGTALLQEIQIPEDLQSKVFDTCFGFLQNNSSSIASKAFSMAVCYRIAESFPELLKELALQIQENVFLQGTSSPGIFTRGNAVLKKINQRLHK